MISSVLDGGGNIGSQKTMTVRRTAAIGDALACTIVADKLIDLGFTVNYQTHDSMAPVILRHPRISRVERPILQANVNLDRAYEHNPQRRQRHFYGIFMDVARRQLEAQGIDLGPSINCRPRLRRNENNAHLLRMNYMNYPKPWVFICPRSEGYKPRQIPDGIWQEASMKIEGTCFWLGLFPAPKGIVDLHCRHLPLLMDFLCNADLLVTVDTGPMHIANALGVKVLAIGQSSSPELHLSDQTDFETVNVPGLNCLNCQENICPFDQWRPPCQNVPPDLIATAVNRAVRSATTEEISCVIPIYKPRAEMINRCLENVLPQVNEVVITRERAGNVPQGILEDRKVRHVMKPADAIGFGRNVNFGFRHTSGKYVLVLNDDVYLDKNAVAKMMEVMKPGVGAVGHLTRYPDGKIYHAGKRRAPNGGIGFPHVDLHQMVPTIQGPVEVENTNGASILFRREAFYAADGYDDGFRFYAEDDDICMKIRLAGWSIWYTPHATGIHDEHQESARNPNVSLWMPQSNARFGMKWAEYFRHNMRTPGLGNFTYLKR